MWEVRTGKYTAHELHQKVVKNDDTVENIFFISSS